MNIYMVSESPRVVAQCVPDKVWERRLFDAVELVSEGAEHWEGEESMFVCHDLNHAWTDWVRRSRWNWLWASKYLLALVNEAGVRGYVVQPEVESFAVFIDESYGMTPRIATIPPRAVPQKFKEAKRSIGNVINAYREYVKADEDLHEMGDRSPVWLREDEVCVD